MSGNPSSSYSRRSVLKRGGAATSIAASVLIGSSASAAAVDPDGKTIDFGTTTVTLEELDVITTGDGTSDERVTVSGGGKYAIVVFADDVTVEHGNVDVTIAETDVSDSRAFYLEGSVDSDSDVDAERYVEFVVEGVEMIASDVLGTDVDVFLDADEANE